LLKVGAKSEKEFTIVEEKIDFELYKFYVELAEKVSDKRASANKYLLTVNTFIISLFSVSTNYGSFAKSLWKYLVPISGALMCITWYVLINSYSKLNSAKFKVIHEMEELMKYRPFKREWEFAEEGKGKAYKPISKLEPYIPLIFLILYIVAAIFAILGS